MNTRKCSKSERDEAIEELFREMYQSLLRLAKGTLDPFFAESAVQDTFTIASLKFDSMMASGNIKGWLVNVLKGEIQNKRRLKQRWEQYSVLVDDSESFRDPVDESSLLEKKDACIGAVGEEAFEQFMERYYYRTPIKTAAEKYGMSESAYKSRTARVRERLREVLKNNF